MGHLKRGTLIFLQSTGNPLTDLLTRLASGSGVVHCGIALGDSVNQMINARGSRGVCTTNAFEGTELYAQMPDELVEPTLAICLAQMGKPYDWFHLFSNPINNVLHLNTGCSVPNKFICSTLLAYSIRTAATGTKNFDDSKPLFSKPMALIDPQDVLDAFPQKRLSDVWTL